MKNKYIYLPLCLLGLLIPSLQAQIVSVAAGSGFNIKAGTVVGAAGLDLTPSADFSITSSLSRSTVANNPSNTTTINRSYQFETTTAAYTGDIKINYEDTELNGLAKSDLKLLYNDGSVWTFDNSSVNNVNANFVSTTISAKTLNELTLGRISVDLGVPELSIVSQFNVIAFANPFSYTFKLGVTTTSAERVKVSVYDAAGRLIEQLQANLSEIENQEIGNDYPSGVYNVIVNQGADSKTVRVIKNR